MLRCQHRRPRCVRLLTDLGDHARSWSIRNHWSGARPCRPSHHGRGFRTRGC